MVAKDASSREDAGSQPGTLRFRIGLVVLILGVASPALAFAMPLLPLPAALKATLAGLLLLGIPEALTLLAVAIMGRPGFERVKHAARRFLERHAPPEVPGVARYRIGLVMFVTPLLYAWLSGYWPALLPGVSVYRVAVCAAFDVLFFASVFVLGGRFWDKVRALFMRDAWAVLPKAP